MFFVNFYANGGLTPWFNGLLITQTLVNDLLNWISLGLGDFFLGNSFPSRAAKSVTAAMVSNSYFLRSLSMTRFCSRSLLSVAGLILFFAAQAILAQQNPISPPTTGPIGIVWSKCDLNSPNQTCGLFYPTADEDGLTVFWPCGGGHCVGTNSGHDCVPSIHLYCNFAYNWCEGTCANSGIDCRDAFSYRCN